MSGEIGLPPSDEAFAAAGLLDDLTGAGAGAGAGASGGGDDDDEAGRAAAIAGRLDLLRWMHGHGLTIEEMVEAKRTFALGAAVGDRRLLPGERLTIDDAVERSVLTDDQLIEFATAFGLRPIGGSPAGEIGLTAAEVHTIELFELIGALFSRPEMLAFVRVVGSSLARIGEAAVSLFLADVEGPHIEAGSSELELAEKVLEANGRLDGFAAHLDPLLRRHVLQAIERTRVTTIDDTERFKYRYAVGFVDLVGFTALSSDMPARELARFLREFEAQAHDVASETGARIVKLIGDEVMFASTDAAGACETGRALMRAFSDDHVRIAPRGGLAYGDVVLRGGDYYGPVVNVASRLVDEAVPGELLVTEEFAEAAHPCVFEPAGRRQVKGFAEPIAVRSFVMD